ncbi:MaoC/PaaZ C-terminal domain-containing protein [Actinophytocola sp.]|uniref:MaoC/PaaZ C-terminal domain-containing protein n=1 Tax=Actinophytocola sp. TaxID=1872138 RepID=UPI003D6A7C47
MITGWFDDIELGEETVTEGRTVTEADIVAFASLSGDWHPLHTNIEFARKGPFGERIGHGMLALAITTGLATIDRASVLAFYGVDRLRFIKPTLINDTIHVATTVTGKSDRNEHSGTVSVDVKAINQRDETILVATFMFLVARRPVSLENGPIESGVR